jgi:capsular exopolysaccharide synthesis family protein
MIGDASSSPLISITSTISGEGKTFLAVNLGAILAMTNKRVVILDLDMRRPRVHAAFDEENSEKGISTILINKYSISDSIRSTRLDNLFYIPSGPVPPNPSELLLTAGFDQLIEELRASFDLIILDTPPIGVVTDGKIILQKSDLAIYVVRANYSQRSFLKEISALHETHTTNLGVVLNSANRSGTEKYGYGYYENRKKKPVHV